MFRIVAPALAFLAGAFASRLLLRIAPSSIDVDRAQPLLVATNWHSFGLVAWALLVCTLLTAGATYAWDRLRPSDDVRLIPTLAAAALAMVVGLFFTPIFSSDVYAYAAYGHMANAGINPYAHATLQANDALFRAAIWQWGNPLPICAYGPLFVALTQLVERFTHGFGITAQLNALRVLSCIGLLAAGACMRDPRRAAMLVLNPVALWSAIEGHNDTIMLAIVLGGVALYRRNAFLGALVTALGALIKIPALAATSGLAAEATIRRRQTIATVGGAVVGIGITALASLAWIRGVTIGTLAHGHYAPQASFQALAGTLAGSIAGPAIAAVCALALLVYAHRIWKADAASGWAVAAIAAWLLIPNPYPWYGLWLLAIGIFARNPRVQRTIVALVWVCLVRYIPDASGTLAPGWNAALGTLATLPVLLLWLPLRDSAILNRS